MKNALRDGLYAVLGNDAQLTNMGSKGVFHRIAPQGKLPPYIIYQVMTSRPTYTLGGRKGWSFEVMVKVIAEGFSAELADQIDERCDFLLTDKPFAVVGGTVIYIRRKEDIGYPEVDTGRTFQHAGGIYEIQVNLP